MANVPPAIATCPRVLRGAARTGSACSRTARAGAEGAEGAQQGEEAEGSVVGRMGKSY
jgi:hypothetical protein